MNLRSKLPRVGTTIFTVMSKLAQEVGAVNLSQGFPDFDSDPNLHQLVYKEMQKGHNQYAPMPGLLELRRAIAKKSTEAYGAAVRTQNVTITAGATQAIYCAITAVVYPGDEVIVIEPAYDCYQPAIELSGGEMRSYRLSAPDYKINWKAFARLITGRTRLIIINNPHNPTGKILDDADMKALQRLVAGTDILLLSDEVYEHIVFDDAEHCSVLRYPELKKRSFVVFSFGKTFHLTGWKMGYCIAPEKMTRELRKIHQFNVFSVNTPIQYALADYLSDASTYEGLGAFFQKKRDLFLEGMKSTRFKPIHSAGTYFQLFDYSAISNMPDTEFCKWLTTEHGVAAIPVSVFYATKQDDRVVRFCFAKKEETLQAALKKLQKI